MITPDIPSGYSRIRVVSSFQELVSTRFGEGVNALCWKRTLLGDFREVVQKLSAEEGITTLDEWTLQALPLTSVGKLAVETLLRDLQLLRELGVSPVLDCIRGYERDDASAIVATDVYSFHADSAPVEADTFLCSYTDPASEGIRNEDAQRRVDIPAIRAELLRDFGGADDEDFREYLSENRFDLHYAPVPGARPFSFGVGNLWRIAIEYPGSPVPPCIHRAPATSPGDPARLLLIA